MEKRILKITFNKSGGTASKGGITTRLTLPKAWVDEMQITPGNREVEVTFENNKIIINKLNGEGDK